MSKGLPTQLGFQEKWLLVSLEGYFTALDSRHGYWQVALNEESTKLTTFMTPWGAYRFKRSVMGLISAGDKHNRRGEEALKGIENLVKVVEDVLVFL